MTREEFLSRYNAGERDFRGVVLQLISLDGVQLKGVDFTGAIFNEVSFNVAPIYSQGIFKGTRGCLFTNCNFSCTELWFCEIPKLFGCNFQYSVMEGCYFGSKFIDCDWRNSQIIGATFDDAIFEGCNLTGQRFTWTGRSVKSEVSGLGWFGIFYKNSFDSDRVFHSGIFCVVPDCDMPF